MKEARPKLVSLVKKRVGTGWLLSLYCNTCHDQFPLSQCHHLTCQECKTAYCPNFRHECLQVT